ncbi:MAG: YbhB/YbcL family Raf kinase inhibitor-like protein [Acidimicrobiales bacterium]|nr:YbhB/YbcL family Raf kinase inhibitor-like protein [Acidimicrobiales bacterium]MCB1015263.1 YbhB/YbcL family Raf kinase inhibitor-like protein [Acidimicrobiales bacterium]MCB9371921.1 YbhB/YbcL family Raf kinase inhibitor-like protein [Microthrixaceae bacterium]
MPPARPSPRRPALVAALVAAGLVVGACSSTDGRELAEPDPELTATAPPTTAPAGSGTAAPFLALSSPAFDVAGTLPERFTCDGEDVSPPLTITDVPADAESLVLSLTDPDAGDFVHWVMAAVPPDTTRLTTGEVPPGAVLYPNDFGAATYDGPCPPEGESHQYVFTVHVLSPSAADLVGPDETNGAAVLETVARLAATSAAVTVTYPPSA